MAAIRTVWFSFRIGCHGSTVSLSALNVSPLTQTIAPCGDRILASVPLPAKSRSSPTTNTLVFSSSSFILPSFAWFYIFFCTGQMLLSLSAGVLQALLCLKVYTWWICGERCTPRPLTLPPSCSPPTLIFDGNQSIIGEASCYCCVVTKSCLTLLQPHEL